MTNSLIQSVKEVEEKAAKIIQQAEEEKKRKIQVLLQEKDVEMKERIERAHVASQIKIEDAKKVVIDRIKRAEDDASALSDDLKNEARSKLAQAADYLASQIIK